MNLKEDSPDPKLHVIPSFIIILVFAVMRCMYIKEICSITTVLAGEITHSYKMFTVILEHYASLSHWGSGGSIKMGSMSPFLTPPNPSAIHNSLLCIVIT